MSTVIPNKTPVSGEKEDFALHEDGTAARRCNWLAFLRSLKGQEDSFLACRDSVTQAMLLALQLDWGGFRDASQQV